MRSFFRAALLAVFASLPVFSLPCVDSYLNDTSGEYVYYEDNTFLRKSYVGFLYYDDSAFSARYYAPADKDKKLPPKDVTILVSVEPNSNHLTITGEKIITSITPEDTDIVNYLHDLLYDFTEYRQKVWEVSPETVEPSDKRSGAQFADRGIAVEEDYPQFGGKVSVLYDYLIPIFNIRKIVSSDGSVMLEAVTSGLLVSSNDKSFAEFSGFPDNLFSEPVLGKSNLNAAEEKQSFIIKSAQGVSQKIELDSLWQHTMENVWFLGDKAMISVNVVALPENGKEKYLDTLKRRMILGTENSYIVWKNLDLKVSDEKIEVSSYYYQNAAGKLTKDKKIFTKLSDSEYGFITFTVFESEYRKNHAYFDSILKSYHIER